MSRFAIVSVFNKVGVQKLARFLVSQNYTILSTGGTYRTISEELSQEERKRHLRQVSDFTGFPEILGGRVKTLHPRIYGGLLARRDQPDHLKELKAHSIPTIDLVVCNLYPFARTQDTKNPLNLEQALELIDIGGVTLLRAAAKNFPSVTTLCDPDDYSRFTQLHNSVQTMEDDQGNFRRRMAIKAFEHTSDYDAMISRFLIRDTLRNSPRFELVDPIHRTYQVKFNMKYGCNPQQELSQILSINSDKPLPIRIIHGQPGYINLLDALNSWQLVHEAGQIFTDQAPVVATFKHTSPAGVAVYSGKLSLTGLTQDNTSDLDPTSLTFLNARYCDPKSSFGDFLAINQPVTEQLAKLIKREVSDGIVAPDFTPEALEILNKKKRGKYLILKADPTYTPQQTVEIREMYGMAISQSPNTAVIDYTVFQREGAVPTKQTVDQLTDQAKRDLLLANITLKYAQSNNVVMAKDGQVIGVAAGQQSRVDAVKLAGRKASIWWLRRHPKALELYEHFKPEVKRQQKTNALIDYVEGEMTEIQRTHWESLFTTVPEQLTAAEKQDWLKQLTGVSLASDAFFPFRDNIDHASRYGVTQIIQPGGSTNDPEVIEACNQYGIVMVMTGARMFTH